MSTDYTFEEHDSLGRKNFANFLYKLIENQQNYRRDTESAGYTIAIDAAYGAGKTYFLKMFQSMVKAEGKYQTVYYNAWEHDLYEDAFTPILSLIASDDAFVVAAEDQDHSGVKEKVRSFVGHAAPTIIHSLVRAVAPGTLADGAAAGLGHLIEKWGDAQCDAYTQLEKSLEDMKAALQKATRNNPLIFIIDELDRCSPTFAIKTLEVVKHLLNVDGVTFVMAVDMRQLCAATRNFFGQTMDAEGYLCKIFDYMTVMPVPDVRAYIHTQILAIDPLLAHMYDPLFRFITAVLTEEAISLRMIDTLLSAYRILRDYLLTAYHHDDADALYFYCLFLKFCHPDLFQRMVTSSDEPTVVDYLSKHVDLGDPVKALKLFNRRLAHGNNNIKHVDNCQYYHELSNTSEKNKIEIGDQSLTLTSSDSCAIYDYNTNPMLSLDDMLFVPDLRKFSQIKHLTYGQYIHQQLEMFNYVMPAENPDE